MLKTPKQSLKYSYPALRLLKTWFCKATARYGPKQLLFDREAIEARADAHCQNFFSGKDITPKTTQPFFKSSYELPLSLWRFYLEVIFWAAFQSRSHRNSGRRLLPELPLWQRYYAKNHSAFLLKLLWFVSNNMKLLSGSRVLGCFSIEKP